MSVATSLLAACDKLKRKVRALGEGGSYAEILTRAGRNHDAYLAQRGVRLLRPSYRNCTPRPGEELLKPIRQLIESVNDTLKGQLDLELHGNRSPRGVGARVPQRTLAMTAAIWQNRATGQPITRSLIAYDH
ncbi:hypothetical protein Q9G87_33485 [Nonomuraea sp. G32]|uniref:hypothetical protein n=1 Tax=Nonomuraea sp. G32 TaxID=3067274 RepID=UPI00273BE408|nr:hypothetical protein [Nonomuraea sp. G32]MDP4506926.1 hypothetical protein [Nonomuraea sp. G32]